MDPFSLSITRKVARESRSGMADAPVVTERPRRLSGRLSRWFGRAGREDLCQADLRDRSPKIASAPGTR